MIASFYRPGRNVLAAVSCRKIIWPDPQPMMWRPRPNPALAPNKTNGRRAPAGRGQCVKVDYLLPESQYRKITTYRGLFLAGQSCGIERMMKQMDLPLEEAIRQIRQILPADSATAQSIDQHEPWELIATKAIDDGYIDSAQELARFVEACLRCSM